ncbi:hypothetical protein E2I00_017701, partial [Balaenoptera physalus]
AVNPVDAVGPPTPLEPVVISVPSQLALPPEPAQLCKSELHVSSPPAEPILATLRHHQGPAPKLSPDAYHPSISPSSSDECYDADGFHQRNSLKHLGSKESLNSSTSNRTSDTDHMDARDMTDDEAEAGSASWMSTRGYHTFLITEKPPSRNICELFAHPDLPLSICDQKDPRDQMVQLSDFHAGSKGSVAEKPYNCILGETLQPHEALPNDTEENRELVLEGLPFLLSVSTRRCTPAFICGPDENFLGYYDNCYVLTFPSGYGRLVLTAPWEENAHINCSKTSYMQISSPMLLLHRITTKIFSSPNDRSFCSLEGKWNGVKYAKYSTGGHTVFTETKKLPVIRRKAVSLDLKIRDIDAAIEARHKREERQRAEA